MRFFRRAKDDYRTPGCGLHRRCADLRALWFQLRSINGAIMAALSAICQKQQKMPFWQMPHRTSQKKCQNGGFRFLKITRKIKVEL